MWQWYIFRKGVHRYSGGHGHMDKGVMGTGKGIHGYSGKGFSGLVLKHHVMVNKSTGWTLNTRSYSWWPSEFVRVTWLRNALSVCVLVSICLHLCVQVSMNVCMCLCICVCRCLYMCTCCMYVFSCICVYVCLYTYTYAHHISPNALRRHCISVHFWVCVFVYLYDCDSLVLVCVQQSCVAMCTCSPWVCVCEQQVSITTMSEELYRSPRCSFWNCRCWLYIWGLFVGPQDCIRAHTGVKLYVFHCAISCSLEDLAMLIC